ncbi:MAG TPA: agmatinase [Chloroflexota bacterium]|nr:agmatinase [Chloroflexota bacterium]
MTANSEPLDAHEESYAGVGLTFCRVPFARGPEDLAGSDVAVVGAPFDLGTSFRPGTRFGPRAIRSAEDVGGPSARPHLELGLDPFAHLRVVDIGDAPVGPTISACHAGLYRAVGEILRAGAVPIVLGGDHSLSLPVMRALSDHLGPDGYSVIHFDTHADTAIYESGVTTEHAAPFSRAVNEGYVRGTNLIQIGLRGAWPFPAEFDWMRDNGIRWHSMDQVEERGLTAIVDEVIAAAGTRPRTYLTVDIDVLDPAFAPGTGTPEPGGLSTRELLRAVRRIGAALDLCAMDVVEVSPPYDPSRITALAAHRVVLEALSAIALRRSGRQPRPERPSG